MISDYMPMFRGTHRKKMRELESAYNGKLHHCKERCRRDIHEHSIRIDHLLSRYTKTSLHEESFGGSPVLRFVMTVEPELFYRLRGDVDMQSFLAREIGRKVEDEIARAKVLM